MINNVLYEGDGDSGLLPEATLQDLVWQTAHVLTEPLSNNNSENILRYLAEPLEDGPFALRVDQLLDMVRKTLNPIDVSQHLLCASFLLVLNLAITKAFQNKESLSYPNPEETLMVFHLLLHQQRTWGLAAKLIPYICDTHDAPLVRTRLQKLQTYVNEDLKVFSDNGHASA